jgi:hypothetical protein
MCKFIVALFRGTDLEVEGPVFSDRVRSLSATCNGINILGAPGVTPVTGVDLSFLDTVGEVRKLSVDETTGTLEKLKNMGCSLGPSDDPIFLWRIAEAQDHLLETQKERVNLLCEQAAYREIQPRLWA